MEQFNQEQVDRGIKALTSDAGKAGRIARAIEAIILSSPDGPVEVAESLGELAFQFDELAKAIMVKTGNNENPLALALIERADKTRAEYVKACRQLGA